MCAQLQYGTKTRVERAKKGFCLSESEKILGVHRLHWRPLGPWPGVSKDFVSGCLLRETTDVTIVPLLFPVFPSSKFFGDVDQKNMDRKREMAISNGCFGIDFLLQPRESLSRGLQQKIDAKATVSCEQILGPFLIWALSPWFSGNCSGFFLCFEISNLPNLHAVFIKMQCLLLRAFYLPSDQISYRYI